MPDFAYQENCIYCGREQYGPAVVSVSKGEHPCVWCGKTPPLLTEQEYRDAHEKRRREKEPANA